MRLFLALPAPELRGQVKVALEAFGDLEVDEEVGVLALEKIRRSEVDALLVGLDPAVPEHDALIDQVRNDLPQVDLIVLGHDAAIAKLKNDKVRGRVFALQKLPLEPVDFFRTIRRLRERHVAAARSR
ncbi:MAG: hypothetical protein FJ293_12490 [Planctomycetes bacterium]|nr:hypothetical protein [Planctomycetota bacterium]